MGATVHHFRIKCRSFDANPVTVAEIHATIMTAMGVSPKTEFLIEGRPFYVTVDGKGTPVMEVFG